MKYYIIIVTISGILFNLTIQASVASDKSYKFNYRLRESEKVSDAKDLELLKAAEYSLKKHCAYFSIENSRTYDKNANHRTGKFGQMHSKKPRMSTELIINCYDEEQSAGNSYDARKTRNMIKEKYAK